MTMISSISPSPIFSVSPRAPILPRVCLSSSERDPQSSRHRSNKCVANPSSPSSSISSSSSKLPPFFPSSEDVDYLIKLSLGSVAGAALVKYGSLFVPGITRQPNVSLAFLVIGTPVVMALTLLILATLRERENNNIF